MLVKEEICAWFKEQSAAKRIDLMCGLLHMCLPLEKRFLGLFLEDLCRADYTSLRAEENRSNSTSEVKKLSNEIKDPLNRSRIIITLCLMYSTNSSCSPIMLDLLTSIQQVIQTCNKNELDRAFENDILTLFTMGIYHPAFTFSQKYELYDHLQFVERYVSSVAKQSQDSEDNSLKGDSSSRKSSTSISVQSSKSNCQPKKVHVQDIELIKGSQWQTAEKKSLYKVHVSWSDGTKGEIYKTYQDFFMFHSELIKLFPKDSGAHKQERHIPFLPQEKGHTVDEMQETMRKYVRQLTSLPDYILQCDHMTDFFLSSEQPTASNQTPSTATTHSHKKNQTSPSCFKEREKGHGMGQSSPAHIKSQIIYNSHLDVELTKKMAQHDSPSGQKSPKSPHVPVHSNNNLPVLPPPATRSVQQQTIVQSPLGSPITSPLSSPYISPASSQCGGSRSNSPTPFNITSWLKKVRLHKYSDKFRNYGILEFMQLKDEELEKQGLTKGAQKRFRLEMDAMKAYMKPGMNGTFVLEMPVSRPNQGYSSCSSSSSSSSSSFCSSNSSQVPNKALFMHHQHPHQHQLLSRGVGSREASPSLSDESSSPADSPLPQLQDNGNHSPRVDSESGLSDNRSKQQFHHSKMMSNGDVPELNGHIGHPHHPHQNGHHMTLHNIANMVRPMVTYAMPHPGMLIPRPNFYTRSPRSPVIRPDGTPGFMPVPRLANGTIPSHVMAAPVSLQQQHNLAAVAAEVGSSTAVSCSNGVYASNSQGTMTSPVFAAPGAYPLTAVVSSGSLMHSVTRPSTLDVQQQAHQQQQQQQSLVHSAIQTSSVATAMDTKLEGSPVPGVLTITPEINVSVFQGGSSNVTSTTTVSYSLAAGYRNASPTPVMTSSSSIGATVPVPTSATESGLSQTTTLPPLPHLLPGANNHSTLTLGSSGNPQLMAPPTTVPTPVQQQHPCASDSPGSDCSQCANSGMPPPPSNNTIHSYGVPQMWPPHPPIYSPAYIPLNPGSNGLVTPPQPHGSYISQAMQSYMPNGYSQEQLYLHNNHQQQQHMLNLINHAMAQPHHQQMLAMQHNYHAGGGGGGGYVNNPHSSHGGGGGGKAKTFACYNCGQPGHKAFECQEQTMEAITNPGTYHLNMKPKENSE